MKCKFLIVAVLLLLVCTLVLSARHDWRSNEYKHKRSIKNRRSIARDEPANENPPPCESKIYCHGPLLDTIQMSHLYNDSKTFVDMKLKGTADAILEKFVDLMEKNANAPTRDVLKEFVTLHFDTVGTEFEDWRPTDWKEHVPFLDKIKSSKYREWAKDLHDIWLELGRKMTSDVALNPDKYSIIHVEHPVIVPGGRFREFYYWDSYWIVRGLMLSEMFTTTKGMLQNFLSMIERFGLIPNGGRVYYNKRSQPPLLAPMIKSYVERTGDVQFAKDSVEILEQEFHFWLNNRTVAVNGHELFVYGDKSRGPRPESYREDKITGTTFDTDAEREEHFSELKAAAESGMDFTSRWFITADGTNEGSLTDLKCRYIVPVELNAILYWNARIISEFYGLKNNLAKAAEFEERAQNIFVAIQEVLWHDDIGAWLDYDLINNKRRNYFTPTNLSPLWMGCYNNAQRVTIADKVLKYIENMGIDNYPGGVPNTLNPTGEQWDFPNVWAPMQYILIMGLRNLDDPRTNALAYKWADRWVLSNFVAYQESKVMFEKYSVEEVGGHGGGGEYDVQFGFGWTNGVVLELLDLYGDKLNPAKARDDEPADEEDPPSCESKIYCYGPLLDTIQMAHLYNDSKTFVDMTMKGTADEILEKFEDLMEKNANAPTRDVLKEFVTLNFITVGTEFEDWRPTDWKEQVAFLDKIKSSKYREFAKNLHDIWLELGRKMTSDVALNPDKYSIIHVENPVIVPGGRFLEFYYWDSYWIVRGLLLSEMFTTTKGMLQNFLSIIERFGMIPNGGRVYYKKRSQPPLLAPMIKSYVEKTGDVQFAKDSVENLEREFNFWLNNRTVVVNGYELFQYGSTSRGPRPESYREDKITGTTFDTDAEREEHYSELKAAAESGMDFSSRWFITADGTNEGSLTDLKCRHIVPVELNAILYWNARIISEFYGLKNNVAKAAEFEVRAQNIFVAIQKVLWHEDIGAWLDYDLINNKRRNYFTPTNLSPLWMGCYNSAQRVTIADKVLKYIENMDIDKYPGGVPNSLNPTGEQWDFPNVWAPMQYILIMGLRNLEDPRTDALAYKWADRWVLSNFVAYQETKVMYEKYSVEEVGGHGGGGEYDVQFGFGWTNGVVLELLDLYGDKLNPVEDEDDDGGAGTIAKSSLAIFLSIVMTTMMRLLG